MTRKPVEVDGQAVEVDDQAVEVDDQAVEAAGEGNRSLAQVTRADDFIVSGKLVSLIMTQLAENPELRGVRRPSPS
jgi:hypothetical protein